MQAAQHHSLLMILQGMDTSGKDGAIRHVLGRVNPHISHTGRPPLPHPASHYPPGCRLLGPATYPLDSRDVGSGRRHSLEPEATKEPLVFATHVEARDELGKRSSIERVFLFFRLQRPPYSGWSTIVGQVALSYTASLVVALAAWQAHRPDLIRSPKRVLAHLWEVSEL
jgi:Polyphosphate kinase 2 (PPK2)